MPQLFALLLICARFYFGPESSIYFVGKLMVCLWLFYRVSVAAINARNALRQGRSTSSFLKTWLNEFLPLWAQRLLRLEGKIYSGAFRSVFKKPVTINRPSEISHFSISQGKTYSLVVFAFVMACLIDIPLFLVITKAITKSNDILLWMTGVHVFLFFYTILWLMSDKYYIKNTGHWLTKEHLNIEMGFRMQGVIDVSNIKNVAVVTPKSGANEIATDRRLTTRVAPFEPVNVLVEMDQGEHFIHVFGFPRRLKTYIGLYLDKPKEFTAALSELMSISSSRTAEHSLAAAIIRTSPVTS